MGELLGITGAISSGKSTAARFFCDMVENHAFHESNEPIIEIANRFNQLLEAELNFETTDDDTELVNQVLIWMPDIIAEHLHHDVTWNHIAIVAKDTRTHPELYTKLFIYIKQLRANPKLAEATIAANNKANYRALLQWLGGYFMAKISPTIWYDEIFRRIALHDARADLVVISGVRSPSDAAVIKQHGGRVIAITRPQTPANESDVTEASRHAIEADITIQNNGTLEQLGACIETVWNDIAAGNPKNSYRAA